MGIPVFIKLKIFNPEKTDHVIIGRKPIYYTILQIKSIAFYFKTFNSNKIYIFRMFIIFFFLEDSNKQWIYGSLKLKSASKRLRQFQNYFRNNVNITDTMYKCEVNTIIYSGINKLKTIF